MAHISPYGDVTTSALNMDMPHKNAAVDLHQAFSVQQGEVTKVYTNDDPENASGDEEGLYTLYDVRITKPDGTTENIRRCRALQPIFGGGINNFFESVTTDPSAEADDLDKTRAERRGHNVLVAFIGGYKGAGIILGSLPHKSPVAKEARPTTDDGVYTAQEIQGLNIEINNEGEYTLSFNGPKDDEGKIVDDSVGPTVIKIDKTGAFTVTTKDEEQVVTVDQAKSLITLKCKDTVFTMDGAAKKISVVADVVEVGAGTLESQVLGDTLEKTLGELCDEIMAIIVPTGVGPSGTPTNAAKFAAIKAKLKKCLSKKHKVE